MYDKVKTKIAQAWDENPLAVIAVGALATTAAAKLVKAMSEAGNARAWQKEIKRREYKTYHK
jgi:hypothetical protein